MTTKETEEPVDSPRSPSVWAVKFLVASERRDNAGAEEARKQLREMGWEIRRITRGAKV